MRRETVERIEIASDIFPANAKITAVVATTRNEVNDCVMDLAENLCTVTKASHVFPLETNGKYPL